MRFRRSMHNRPDLPAPPDQQLSSEGSQDWMVDWAAWAKSAQAGLASLQKTCLQSEHEAAIKAKEKHTKAFQHLLATEQKKANKRLKDNTSSRQITALQDSAGSLANTQQGLLQVAHNFFAAQAAAPTEVSPGGPLPWGRRQA